MKRNAITTVMQVSLLLITLCYLTSCATHYKTDNHRPDKYKYRKAGRAW